MVGQESNRKNIIGNRMKPAKCLPVCKHSVNPVFSHSFSSATFATKNMWNLKAFELIYSRYESSGLKVRDFCANEVINEAKFYYWQKKLRKSKLPAQNFVPIVLDSELPVSGLPCPPSADISASVMPSPEYEILYPCGTSLRVKGIVDAELLKVLLQLIR